MATTDTFRPHPAGIGSRFAIATHSLFGAFSVWNDRRSTRKMLGTLSDHELDDIGLCRGDIDDITG